MAYISDSTYFSTVNASANTLIETVLPQGAVNFYNPTMVVNTWYRYYDLLGININESGGILNLVSDSESTQNGILQKLSNLVEGESYNIKIDFNVLVVGSPTISIYSGTVLQSTHIISGDTTQTIKFIAGSTQDTLLIDTKYIGSSNLLQINSVSIETVPSAITFLSGFTVKPNLISGVGTVTFTDGTNEITPNQLQCESYGYTYDQELGTCSAFIYNTNLDRVAANENNRTFGAGNSTETGTNNTFIMGESNSVKGFSKNSIIIGNQNEIANGVNNASVSGTLGEATADNSTVLGGNAANDALGKRQSIRVMYGKLTTSASTLASNLNNTSGSYFIIPENTAVYFHATCLAVRVGGTSASGAPGDYWSAIERGVAINKSGVLSIQRERDVIKTSGTTSGWVASTSITGGNFRVNVRGANNMDVEWTCDIKLTQIKTGVTL